jgi:ABC-type nickel/cobalt efflux system permease component RcnA
MTALIVLFGMTVGFVFGSGTMIVMLLTHALKNNYTDKIC